MLGRVLAQEVALDEAVDVFLRRHERAEVGGEGAWVGEDALHVGVAEDVPHAGFLVMADRFALPHPPEPGKHRRGIGGLVGQPGPLFGRRHLGGPFLRAHAGVSAAFTATVV
ncbi:hypothetical protein [Streptomyces ambofaciens]